VREDLLRLTPDALSALANKGFVKAAQKKIAAGDLPEIEVDDDGTVVGRFDEAKKIETRIPMETPLEDWPCTCGARGKCRHRVALVLAYQRMQTGRASAPPEVREAVAGKHELWSPAMFDDDTLTALAGKRTMSRARSLRRKGYVAKVRRPSAEDSVPTVELATCTVRFLVPREVAHAQTDSRDLNEHVFVVLAVWAFRRADEAHPDSSVVEVEVVAEDAVELGAAPGLGRALALAEEILLEGVVHGRPSQAAHFERVRRDLDKAGLIWPSLCVDEIEEQITAYHARSARYHMESFADLVVELHARDRAARLGGALPKRSVLGNNEAMTTDMKHLSLVALGARVTSGERERRADVFFVDSKTSTTLVLRTEWKYKETEKVDDGHALGKKKVAAGASLARLATSRVTTQSAARRANRLLVLKKSSTTPTSVTESEHQWSELPEPLRVDDVAALAKALGERPPRFLRPRLLAEDLRVIAIGEIGEIAYAPGAQHLTALVTDPSKNPFVLRLVHRQAAPGALDLLAHVLSGDKGPPRFVSGTVRRTAQGIMVSPIAILADTLHVLDLAPEETKHPMEIEDDDAEVDAVTRAIHRAREVLAEGAHRGLRHVSPTYSERIAAASGQLSRFGLRSTAERVGRVAEAVRTAQASGQDDAERLAARAWVDALLRVRLCEEVI
jgi:hypothetical protein